MNKHHDPITAEDATAELLNGGEGYDTNILLQSAIWRFVYILLHT